ncbi:DUF1036 domain-containing protein, partial [Rhizobium phaseoli]
MIMYIARLALVVFLASVFPVSVAVAKTYACNKMPAEAYVSYAMQISGEMRVRSWIKVPSGFCIKVIAEGKVGETYYWTARSALPDEGGEAKLTRVWAGLPDDKNSVKFCVNEREDETAEFKPGDKCAHDEYFRKDAFLENGSILNLGPGKNAVKTSEDFDINLDDLNGDLIPKIFQFKFECEANWDSSCTKQPLFQLPEDVEYCTHFLQVTSMSSGSMAVAYSGPGQLVGYAYAV